MRNSCLEYYCSFWNKSRQTHGPQVTRHQLPIVREQLKQKGNQYSLIFISGTEASVASKQ